MRGKKGMSPFMALVKDGGCASPVPPPFTTFHTMGVGVGVTAVWFKIEKKL